MNQRNQHKSQGFTLIEVMTVITIIILLAGITAGGLGFIRDKQNNSKARVDIELLSKGIEEYRLDYGVYPSELDADGLPVGGDIEPADENDERPSQILYNRLFHDGFSDSEKYETYLPELDPRNGKQTLVQTTRADTPPADLTITDPWQRPYLYRIGDPAENPDFDLWSKGKDGQTDVADPSKASGVNSDDIRNF